VKGNIGGAAQPNANAKIIGGAEIMIPPIWLQSEFKQTCIPLFDQQAILLQQNNKLRAARDILLPRLMNGEISV